MNSKHNDIITTYHNYLQNILMTVQEKAMTIQYNTQSWHYIIIITSQDSVQKIVMAVQKRLTTVQYRLIK